MKKTGMLVKDLDCAPRREQIYRELRVELIDHARVMDFEVGAGRIVITAVGHAHMLYFGLGCCSPEDAAHYDVRLGERLSVRRLSKLMQSGRRTRYSNILPYSKPLTEDMMRAALIYHLETNAKHMGPWLRDILAAGCIDEVVSHIEEPQPAPYG